MTGKLPLRFGIPTLDQLLGDASEDRSQPDQNRFGFKYVEDAGTSFCLIGPHGTGKSVLALHFASRYLADSLIEEDHGARIFYVSTDLSHSMALNVWYNFALDTPNRRSVPFGRKYAGPTPTEAVQQQILLTRRVPHSSEDEAAGMKNAIAPGSASLAAFVAGCGNSETSWSEITFVDLAANSAGDDWGFVHRLIAVLPEPDSGHRRHLVIVDAVEGLETLVGEKDAFGETTSRRARIAQVLRTAFNKCHLFFVVEEPAEGKRIPEEFVSDIVIRLRNIHEGGYDRRTVEIQKARGPGHIRGQHSYVIRTGKGTFTGSQENPDDLPVKAEKLPVHFTKRPKISEEIAVKMHNERSYQAYVHVLPSLHQLTRQIMAVKGSARPTPNPHLTEFGVTHLDDMLAQNDQGEKGLPCSTVTALIGDAETHKSALGNSFLYRCLYDEILDLRSQEETSHRSRNVAILLTTKDVDAEGLARRFLKWAWMEAKTGQLPEAKWLHRFPSIERFAGSDEHNQSVLDRRGPLGQREHIKPSPRFNAKVRQLVSRNILCRRLEVHYLNSEALVHIVQQAVIKAQQKIGLLPEIGSTAHGERLPDSKTRYQISWKVRLVIDDFSVIRNTYTAVREDPLFLPFLTFHLKREGVSTLIIDTNPGRPDGERPAHPSDDLRALADHHLYTWRVSFHGESRIAISAIPPISPDQRSRVRELHWDPNRDELPIVDRSLELYKGLEQRDPSLIPLEVRLYAETDLFTDYIAEMNQLLSDFFVGVSAGAKPLERSLVIGMKSNEYRYLHDFCNLQSEHSLDHTLVMAIDEFWAVHSPYQNASGGITRPASPLRNEREYLEADLEQFGNEPRQLFRGLRNLLPGDRYSGQGSYNKDMTNAARGRRVDYFRLPAYGLTEAQPRKARRKKDPNQAQDLDRVLQEIDRIPFAWDFGFLMCRKSAWDAANEETVRIGGQAPVTVGQIMSKLPRTQGHLHNEPVRLKIRKHERPSWRQFLGACQVVAARLGQGETHPLAFDVGTVSGETFSCLLLEMWASEITGRLAPAEAATFCESLSRKIWSMPLEGNHFGLIDWLEDPDKVIDLYMVWLLLVDLLPLVELADPGKPTKVVERTASPAAIASRQWYKGACQLVNRAQNPEPMEAVGLPGHFSTRGDWFLGVAPGSRSNMLADRVLDIFSSRRNNLTRLYSGLGLPTRILGTDDPDSCGRLMTALTWKDIVGEPRAVRYGPLVTLGSAPYPKSNGNGFHWLFRSALRNYGRHARVFQRWNSRTVLMWNQTRAEAGTNWRKGFDVYDQLKEWQQSKGVPKSTADMEDRVTKILGKARVGKEHSWTHFERRCKILRDLLIRSDRTEPVSYSES